MNPFRAPAPVLLVFLAGAPTVIAQTPLSTAFTYQGQLKNGGSPTSGSFNMTFGLSGGSTIRK